VPDAGLPATEINVLPKQVVVGGLGIVQILSWGSSYYLLAVLAGPIASDTGWPLPWIIGALSAGLLVAGIVSPRVGRSIGNKGGRGILALAVLLLAAGLAIIGIAPALPVFIIGWLVLGAGMGAGLYDAAFATLGVIYGATARRSITYLTLWGGFASTVCWPLSAFLVDELGWRGACLTYAAIHIAVCLPIILLILPSRMSTSSAADMPKAKIDHRLTEPERRSFFLLAAVLMVGSITMSIVSVHLLTLLQAQGVSLAVAVSLGALIGPAQVGARVIEMLCGARLHPVWTLAAAVGFVALGLVLLAAGFPIVALSLLLYGGGNGLYSIARGTLPLALFGPQRYAPLIGRLALPNLIAQALAPSLGAVVLVQAGANGTLLFLAVLAVANFALLASLFHATAKLRRAPAL
jgi:hypothetical protein